MPILASKQVKLVLLNVFFLFTSISVFAQIVCKPTALLCEYLKNPLGIDAATPRLSWQLADKRMGAKQLAFQIFVAIDSFELTKEKGTCWQTAKINQPKQLVVYEGKKLSPFTKYYWAVKIWDKDGKAALSAINSFETGMMEASNWKGAWINDGHDKNEKAAPYFRKTFTVSKKIKSAKAYIAAAGLYELSINGGKIGDHRLDPMYTRFDRRTLYVTYDATTQLLNGQNAIGVLLGNGWYNHQSTAVWDFDKAPWRNRPTFCLDLRIEYTDGTVETITSGKEWKTSLSPITFNSIYTAEHYDARLEQNGWNTASFNDSAWHRVIFRSAPSNNIVAQALQPIRNVEKISTKVLNRISDSVYVFDLGRNISGVSSIQLKGNGGTIIRLKHGERLYANGRVDQSNIDVHYRPTDDKDPFQTDIFILSGKGEESFSPKFNYKGFRYVEVTANQAINLTKESLAGYFMHSDVQSIGHVNSSNPTIDKIWEATNNSYLSNLFGYPTDCPQREKNGWTGDAHIASETGLYNFDAITIYEKWMADHRDEQQPNGILPSIIPTDGWGYEWGNGPDWTSTIAIIPWNIYLFYGDTSLLSVCYNNIKKYVNHISTIAPNGLTTWGLGDWVPVKSTTPVEFTSTAYYFVDVTILANTAKLFGKQDDYKNYTALAAKIKSAFNSKYLNAKTGVYGDGVQTEMSVPLQWNLVPDSLRKVVAANLAKRVEADGDHLDVGLLGTKSILNALSENGFADLAYKVAAQETFPSWGWWMANGATTLYENWPIDAKSDISMNHIMFGEIGAWLYKALGGIKPDPKEPGFKHILLSPNFVDGLDHFETNHSSPYGVISSSWKKENGNISYTAIVPPNASATVYLPFLPNKTLYRNGQVVATNKTNLSETIGAGTYLYEWK